MASLRSRPAAAAAPAAAPPPPLPPGRRCFARVARRCKEADGCNAAAERWYETSIAEACCSDCVNYYSKGACRAAVVAAGRLTECTHSLLASR